MRGNEESVRQMSWFRRDTLPQFAVRRDEMRVLQDAITAALNAGKAAQVRERCLETIQIIDRFEPGLEIHTADTLRSIDINS